MATKEELMAERERDKEEHAKTMEFLNNFFTKIEEGVCPVCNKPMKPQQVGRCVYANPCGHRLFQGKLKKGK